MANFSCKIAHVVLFLYCLTQTHFECGKDNDIESKRWKSLITETDETIVAIVSDIGEPSSRCGGVWISGKFLLTAASCLDKKGKIDLSKKENSLIKVKVEQALLSRDIRGLIEEKKESIGAAIAHPLYRRVDGMTIAYDLAVVRVNFDNIFLKVHKIGTLCKKKDTPKSELIALGLSGNKICEWQLVKNSDEDIALVDNHKNKEAEEYFIDKRKQFTTQVFDSRNSHLILGTNFTEEEFGGPVLDRNNGRCILGIMNFAATKDGEYYITSTRVTPVIDWIEYTMNYLRNVTGQSKLTRLHGKAGMIFWKIKNVNQDPFRSDPPPGIIPGTRKQESKGKPGKPLR